jgi:hypothetical protein
MWRKNFHVNDRRGARANRQKPSGCGNVGSTIAGKAKAEARCRDRQDNTYNQKLVLMTQKRNLYLQGVFYTWYSATIPRLAF